MRIHKELRPLAAELRAAGYRLEQGRKHIKVLTRDGRVVSSMSTSPSDSRGILNQRAFLRRIGVLPR